MSSALLPKSDIELISFLTTANDPKRPSRILQINVFLLDSRSRMKKIDLGQAITILANFGVLIGILLLVYELNQIGIAMVGMTGAKQ